MRGVYTAGMPTGYTAIIEEKDGATFEEFVWRCARAFGALVEMREDSLDTEVPERLKVDAYYVQVVCDAEAGLVRLKAMNREETSAAAAKEYADAKAAYRESVERAAVLRDRYAAMRAKVVLWKPPTEGHAGLRSFMLEQIDLCTRNGVGPFCSPPTRQSGSAWHARRMAWAAEEVERSQERLRVAEALVAARNEWIDALRKSVPQPKGTR